VTGRIQLHVGSRRPRRPLQERRRNRQAEGLGGFEVDDELILRGCSTGRFHISQGDSIYLAALRAWKLRPTTPPLCHNASDRHRAAER